MIFYYMLFVCVLMFMGVQVHKCVCGGHWSTLCVSLSLCVVHQIQVLILIQQVLYKCCHYPNSEILTFYIPENHSDGSEAMAQLVG